MNPIPALSKLEWLSPAGSKRNTLHSLALLLSSTFSAKIPFFSLLKAPRAALWQESSHPPSTPPAAPRALCAPFSSPAASQLDAAVKKILTRLGKEDFRLGARKRDSSKRGKLPKKGFVPGCGAADVLVGADPFLHSCSPRCSQLPARSQPCHSPPAHQGINQFSTMD